MEYYDGINNNATFYFLSLFVSCTNFAKPVVFSNETPDIVHVVYKCMIFTKNGTLPVPGGPAKRIALPAIFLDLISSTTTPAACDENKQK